MSAGGLAELPNAVAGRESILEGWRKAGLPEE